MHTSRLSVLFASLLLLTACGDDPECEGPGCSDDAGTTVGPDGSTGDAGPGSDAMIPDFDAGMATDPPEAVIAIDPARIARDDANETVVEIHGRDSSGGGLSFEWTIPDGTFVDGTGPTDPTVRVTFPGTADHEVLLRVENGLGSDLAMDRVRINRVPVVEVTGGGVVDSGTTVTLDASGSSDPDGDALSFTWTLLTSPEGASATVDGSGDSVTITPDYAGPYGIELVVSDGIDEAEPVVVNVVAIAPEPDPPEVTVDATPRTQSVGASVRVCASATDATGVDTLRVTVDGTDLPLAGDGCGDATVPSVGRYPVVATATDAYGNVGVAETEFFGRDGADDGPPTVALTSPADGAVVDAITDVIGTATDSDLVSYRLEAREPGASDWTRFAGGTMAVSGGALGEVDPGRFVPGDYEARLCAQDAWGNESCTPSRIWSFGGGAAPGFMRLAFRDASLDLIGLPIVVWRIYDSRDLSRGDFGHGWTMELEGFGEVEAPSDPGAGWEETGCTSFPFSATVVELTPHIYTVHVGSRTYRFRLRMVGRGCITGAAQVDAVMEPLPGTDATIRPVGIETTGLLLLRDGSNRVVRSDFSNWTPSSYEMSTPDGRTFRLTTSRITQITDVHGNSVSFDGTRVTHSSGDALSLTRDAMGRVSAIELPGGATRTYRYDSRSDLVATVDSVGAETTYLYDSMHRLRGIVDPRGGVPGMLEYDADGRVTAIIDPSGRRVEIMTDPSTRQQVVTDRLGNTTILFYDERGNVVRRIDALGHETTWTYDADGNLTSVTDPTGATTNYEYDGAGNRTAMVDAEGRRWEWTYDAEGRQTSQTDPLGNSQAIEYDADGLVTAQVDAEGHRTTFSYAGGALTGVALPEGGSVSMVRDSAGRMTSMTDAAGRTTSLTYGADGQPTSSAVTVDINGTPTEMRWGYEHDARGAVEGLTGPDGDRSSVSYDSAGRATAAVAPDGSMQGLEYGSNGQVSAVVGPSGERTVFGHDVEDRTTEVTLPSGARMRRTLNANGLLTGMDLPGGRSLTYDYDAAGRVTTVTDAMGRATTYGYDDVGRITSVTRPDGMTTTYTRDAAGRIVETSDPAHGTTAVTYDGEGRPISMTVPAGASSTITRDAAGRPTRIVDPTGRALDYTYDTVGMLTEVSTAAGDVRITRNGAGDIERIVSPGGATRDFTYDVAGRLMSRSGGPRTAEERFTYDGAGNVSRFTDATGAAIDYAYDPTGRLVMRSGGGETETLSFGAGGRLNGATTSAGSTMIVYDASGAMARWSAAAGRYVAWSHDPSGLPTQITTASGDTRYEWDASGRMSAVVDASGGRTSYAYDGAGRVTSATLPNGVEATWTYDASGRVASVTWADGSTTLASETYSRDSAGRITSVDRGGDTVGYTYDAEGRVASETRPDGTTIDYAYDADGNLTQAGSIALSYDASGRLTSYGGDAMAWDAAGRLTSRVVDGVTETYTYDGLGRLSRIDRASGTPARVDLAYGAGDLLERVTVDGDERYLVWDRTGDLPLLLEETRADGTSLVRYTWGAHGLLARTEGGATSYAVSDARRSVRGWTDGAGALGSPADYLAYGGAAGPSAASDGFGFAGEWTIPGTDLVYLRARVLEPRSGRFVTPDPASPDLREPRALNPYLYANGDPINSFDPTGRFSMTSLNVTIAIINVLATIVLSVWDGPDTLVANALGIGSILTGESTLQGVTAQIGGAGLPGGGRGTVRGLTSMVGLSFAVGVDAYFDPPTIAVWVSFGSYIQFGGSGRGLRRELKGGFIIGKDSNVTSGFDWGAVEPRVIFWISSQYVLRRLRPRGTRFAEVIRFIQTHVRHVEISLKRDLDVAIKANLGYIHPNARKRWFRIGFEIKWTFASWEGDPGVYPWNWSQDEWDSVLSRVF